MAPAQIHINFGASPFTVSGDVDTVAEAAGLGAVKGMSKVSVAGDEPSKSLPPVVVAGVEPLV